MENQKSNTAEAELASLNLQIAAVENVEQLTQRRVALRGQIDSKQEYQIELEKTESNIRCHADGHQNRKFECEKFREELIVSFDRLDRLSKSDNIHTLCRILADWEDAIRAVEFYLSSHSNRAAGIKVRHAEISKRRKRIDSEKSALERDLAEVETALLQNDRNTNLSTSHTA